MPYSVFYNNERIARNLLNMSDAYSVITLRVSAGNRKYPHNIESEYGPVIDIQPEFIEALMK
jgi:hypothetical protein